MITVSGTDGIVEIGLNKPPLNLVTRPMLRALNDAVVDVATRDDVRCVIFHGGEARAFCAGSDIKEFDDLGRDASERKILYEDYVLRQVARLPMPTIAAIDGPALGGGFEIALCCDLRVLKRGVKVGLPECILGGLAGNGAVRLARLIGPGRAKRILFTGLPLDAEQALDWGLVEELSEGSALIAARALARTIASRGPISNRLAKELVEKALDETIAAALLESTLAQQAIFDSNDLKEGAKAFFEKREPHFKGQ
jgi:enoyl-CoA hydratase/carnithine racemase